MFFGWGKRNKTKTLPNNTVLILTYRHFNLFFFFSITFDYQYSLATPSGQGIHYQPLTKEAAQKLLPAGEDLLPHIWWRYSLLLLVIAVTILIFSTVIIPAVTQPSFESL